MPRMHGMVSMEHNGTIVLQNKIEKNQRTGKGVVSIKMKNFIHGFKFMPKMNWMQYFILSFQAKVRNQLNSGRIFREVWQTLWEFSSYPPQIFLAPALHSSLRNERRTHLFSKQHFRKVSFHRPLQNDMGTVFTFPWKPVTSPTHLEGLVG